MKKTLFKDVAVLLLLALMSGGVGFGVDRMGAHPIGLSYRTPAQRFIDTSHRDSSSTQIPEKGFPISREIQVVDIGRLDEFLKQNQALVFDVRPNIFYKLGHIPHAYSLQEKEFDADFVKAKPLIEESLAKGHKIIVYCSGSHCSDAGKTAKRLSDIGVGNLMIFEGGWEAWQDAKLPEEQEAF